MKFAAATTTVAFVLSSFPGGGTAKEVVENMDFQFSSVEMPFPVSDVMANYMTGPNGNDDEGYVIITGGCDSVKGNERIHDVAMDMDLFACLSSGKQTLKFDPVSESFEYLPEMPHERQRHAAVVLNGELYLIGGRDSNDQLVQAIDVYNPETKTWRTYSDFIPPELVTSDLTAWTWGDWIYVAGGFLQDYTAVGNTYRILVSEDGGLEELDNQLATSPHPRGDYQGVVLDGYAYVAGGLTHTSFWCESLTTTERYHMETDTWETLADLEVGRADMAATLLNGHIVALGGETKPEDCAQLADPAYGSFPTDHVTLLEITGTENHNLEWAKHDDFTDERFRFAAVTIPSQNRIYTFGGQLPFDFTCDCFPTSTHVAYGEATMEKAPLSGGAIAGIVILCLVVVGLLVFVWSKLQKTTKEKESLEVQLENEQAAKENQIAIGS